MASGKTAYYHSLNLTIFGAALTLLSIKIFAMYEMEPLSLDMFVMKLGTLGAFKSNERL